MKPIWGLIVFYLLAHSASGSAEIYRCRDSEGRVRFQQTTCESGSTAEGTLSESNGSAVKKSAHGGAAKGPKPKADNLHRQWIDRARGSSGRTSEPASP